LTLTKNFLGDGREKSRPIKNMKITLLRDSLIEGKKVQAGKTVEIESAADGKYLINCGVATEAKASASKKTTRVNEADNRDD
jgi:hypothetical protein